MPVSTSELEEGLYPRGQESAFSLQKAALGWKTQYGQAIKSPGFLISQVYVQFQAHRFSSLMNVVHEPQFPHLVNGIAEASTPGCWKGSEMLCN